MQWEWRKEVGFTLSSADTMIARTHDGTDYMLFMQAEEGEPVVSQPASIPWKNCAACCSPASGD
jgi:hypothetical protein